MVNPVGFDGSMIKSPTVGESVKQNVWIGWTIAGSGATLTARVTFSNRFEY